MIHIRVRLGDHGITAYHSRGHARMGGDGSKVCSGLSAMEYQFLYAVKEFCPSLSQLEEDLDPMFRVGKGDFRVKVRDLPWGEEAHHYRVLSRTLMIGVEMLKKHHPDEIDVIIS